jgi:eukaryotic-like serine/threonine-protein kinase
MKVIAPRLPTPVTPAGGRTGSLPDDVVAEQIQRLKLFSLVAGGMWAVGMLMDSVVLPRVFGAVVSRVALLVQTAAILTAAATFLYVVYAPRAARTKTDAGLWLMVLNAFFVALLETWARDATIVVVGNLSWITVVILLSAMILPSTPRKMAVAAFVAASMGPLGMWFAHLRGLPVPSVVGTLVLYTPNYTCAIAAILPSVMFQRLGRRLREARELGNYELIEPLGQGGMGEVWRARHRLLARHAAVKLVRPEVLGASNDPATNLTLHRFEREAQATAALSSPHSIRLFDFGATDEGSFYYVMELLTGRDLESLVRQFGPVPVERAKYLLQQVCHSLAEAHERGLIHRDVKPANIYACRMGLDYDFVKVLDFGLVKFDDAHHGQTEAETVMMTSVHTTLGTPGYMAPEVILGSGAVDARADVYAVGCVAYFLLTGQTVFQGSTPMEMLVAHVHTPPIPPSQRGFPIPAEIDASVLRCLEKDPDRRPEDAAALLRMIDDWTVDAWSSASARDWWQLHLRELTGPLTSIDGTGRPSSPSTVAAAARMPAGKGGPSVGPGALTGEDRRI